jgi:hypothetical protein
MLLPISDREQPFQVRRTEMTGATASVWVIIRFSFKLVTAMNATSVITEAIALKNKAAVAEDFVSGR